MGLLIVKLTNVLNATTILFGQLFINFEGNTSFHFLVKLFLIVNTWKHSIRNVVLMLSFLITDVNIRSWVRNHVGEHFFDDFLLLFCVSFNGWFLKLKFRKKRSTNRIALRIIHNIAAIFLICWGWHCRSSHFDMTLSGSRCRRVVLFLKTHLSFYFYLLGPIFQVIFTNFTNHLFTIQILLLVLLLFVVSEVVDHISRILTNHFWGLYAFVPLSTVLLLKACNHFILELN